MASTSLFAPIVRAIQPAFIYNTSAHKGKVKIYFSLSSYNNIEEVKGLFYSLIDPNVSSAWGSNSMIKNGSFKIGEIKSDDANSKEYYFEIDFITNGASNFKPLTKNQFYQIQIYLSEKDFPENGIDAAWISENSESVSNPSQATLIRPIGSHELIIDGFNAKEENVFSSLRSFSGRLEYNEPIDNKEGIASYSYQIKSKNGDLLHESPIYYNTLGNSFSLNSIKYQFKENIEYKLIFKYTTDHGYESDGIEYNFKIDAAAASKIWENCTLSKIENDSNMGAIKLTLEIYVDSSLGTIIVQRSDEFSDYGYWSDVARLEVGETLANKNIEIEIYDNLIQGNTEYKYNFIYENSEERKIYIPNREPFLANFEDILLSDSQCLVGIRYNPQISQFKWITQESLTNTLGSKFPIVRKGGDTKYRQFTLSGMLYFDISSYINIDVDSTNSNVSHYFSENNNSLFLSKDIQWEYKNINRKRKLESLARDYAIDFLTNQDFKLFRSEEEGSMIVYLSNISFVPNQTLGRHVYDFTATVTEVAEATEENLIQYGFTKTLGEIYQLILKAIKTEGIVDTGRYSAYVEPSEIMYNNALKLVKEVIKYD